MRHALIAIAGLSLAAPLAAQAPPPTGPSDTRPTGPITGALPITELTEIGGRNVVPHTANDVSLAGSARVRSGDPKIHAMAEQRRLDAVKLAELVRRGQKVPAGYAGPLREAIDGDMGLWRDEYRISEKTFRRARKEWLEGMEAMDASTLALLRAELFTARDSFNQAVR